MLGRALLREEAPRWVPQHEVCLCITVEIERVLIGNRELFRWRRWWLAAQGVRPPAAAAAAAVCCGAADEQKQEARASSDQIDNDGLLTIARQGAGEAQDTSVCNRSCNGLRFHACHRNTIDWNEQDRRGDRRKTASQ